MPRKSPDRIANYTVYMLRCKDGSLYTGYTNNIERRLKQHFSGKGGAKYTKLKHPTDIVFEKKYKYLKNAMKEERRIKRLSKIKKEKLILSNSSIKTKGRKGNK